MTAPIALEVIGLTKQYGGVKAVDDVSFSVTHGSLTAVIGPNGAGKTTMFNLLTRLYKAEHGEVRLYDTPILDKSPAEIARLGMIRTFQSARVYPGMTVLENVMCGGHLQMRWGPLPQMLWLSSARRDERRLAAKAETLLDLVGLRAAAHLAATDLPMGSQKLLEIARALLAEPRLLLLDEPAAGLNDAETADLAMLLQAVQEAGVTIVVIEHNMSLVMGIADQIVVLDAGRVVARGGPAEIRNDPQVIRAYIGEAEAVPAR